MLDINLFRQNPDIVRADLEKRGAKEKLKWVDAVIKKDEKWRKLKQEVEQLRNKRNIVSKEISQLKKQGKATGAKVKEAATIPKAIEAAEAEQKKIRKEIDSHLMELPNILHESVPVGKSEEDNVEVRQIGKKPSFDFEVKSHVDVLAQLDIADIERAAKIAGARFWFIKGELALLELALQKYAVDFMYKKGFTLLETPMMMSRKSYEGVIDLADFEEMMYKVQDEDLYLIATSEHPMIAMFQNEIIEEQLPIKLCGISSCFRKEAGSHGKDTKGIFRGHQFNKIEQVIICKPEDSWSFHEELIRNAEEFFQSLGIHCRIVNVCTGDIGSIAAKKYDLEAWMPAQQKYREVVSCSNCTDYQARRLGIRYRTPEGTKLVHTINSTCVATSRALVAIIENFQNKDGSVNIPPILQPYMDGLTRLEKK